MAIDLQSFCCEDDEWTTRKNITKPFSIGAYTYATNGHIAIRVDRMDDVQEDENPIGVEPVFASYFSNKAMRPLMCDNLPKQTIRIEPEESVECKICNGNGECLHCGQECDQCDGIGHIITPEKMIDSDEDRYVVIGEAFFDLPVIRKIASLPNVNVPKNVDETDPMSFTFDGGIGLVMPCRIGFISTDEILREVIL